MKLEKSFLAIRVLKYIMNNPNCTIPQIRDHFGIESFNPPQREEKNLYKVISFLDNDGFIAKIDNPSMSSRGAHFLLKVTQKGTETISAFKELFLGIPSNEIVAEDLSTRFSKFSYNILRDVLYGLLNELDYETRRILNSKKPRINVLIEKCHAELQEEVSRIIESLISS
ncbi:MAG: hypothetical protein ACFFDK_18085 [Promethearchaeota archaeon]